jgi:hypothetical protein
MDIIKREEQRDQWRQIKQATGDPQTGATNLVQQMEGDSDVDILKTSVMNEEIQKVTKKRFDLAQSAPATSSSLHNLIGYNADTTFAKDLLQHKVLIPSDMDTITAELKEEMCCLWASLRLSYGPVEITPAIYKYYWVSMKQHPWLSLAFTLGTGRFFVS